MKYLRFAALRYVALLALLTLPLAYSQAEVRFGVGIGPGYGYVGGAPVCSYGYYPDYPYACAPYGYYGPSFFSGGVFIGAGPWGHGFYGRPYARGFDGRFAGRGFAGRDFAGRGPVGRGFEGRGQVARSRGGFHGSGSRGGR